MISNLWFPRRPMRSQAQDQPILQKNQKLEDSGWDLFPCWCCFEGHLTCLPPTMPPEKGPRTHRQEDRGLELSQLLLLTTGGKDENPKDLHSWGDQGVQGSIITPSSAFKGSACWTSAWGEITRMRVWNHPPSTNHHGCEKPPATAQAFKNPQGRAQRKEIFFKPNYLCIGYPLGYLGLNIKIRGVQLFEKCKLVVVLISFFGNTVPSFFSFFFFPLLRSQYFLCSQVHRQMLCGSWRKRNEGKSNHFQGTPLCFLSLSLWNLMHKLNSSKSLFPFLKSETKTAYQ